jgi:hypothetical protein
MASKKGRVPLYSGRKLQLIDLVRRLEVVRKRPVCSADIRAYLLEQEESEIGYIQSYGQILIKAALPRPDPVPRLFAVGVHRNRVYYTAELSQSAHDLFERYCAQERAEYLIKRGFLHCLPASVRTALEQAAAHSLARIIESTLPHLESKHLALTLENGLKVRPTVPWIKPDFHEINRREALRMLKAEANERVPYIPSMNHNRHLARICPTILRGQAEPVYCEEIVRTYCATIWPLRAENLEKEVNSLLQWLLVMVGVAVGEPTRARQVAMLPPAK